jgi:hypothetical protein
MLVTTLHETVFNYSRPIERTFTEVRLWPVSDAGQTCREFSLTVDPLRPMTESHDYWGNTVMMFNILQTHGRVVVTGRSVVETHRNPFEQQMPLSEFGVQRAHLDYLGYDGPVEYSIGIDALADDAGLRRANVEALWFEDGSIFKALQNLNALIHERFTFCPIRRMCIQPFRMCWPEDAACARISRICLSLCAARPKFRVAMSVVIW